MLLTVGLAVWFAAANGSERVTVSLGLVTLRQVSLAVVVFSSIILGMLLIFAVGLKADLRMRRVLRQYRDVLHREE